MAQHPGQGFAQEIDENLLRRLIGGISKGGEQRRGRARGEALARGLTGDPFEASAVGIQDRTTADLIADLTAEFGFRRAGQQREERLIGERRTFRAGEAEKGRRFQASESALGRTFGLEQQQRRIDAQGDPFLQALIGAGGRIGGGFLAGRGA